jgi:hypothetical protein
LMKISFSSLKFLFSSLYNIYVLFHYVLWSPSQEGPTVVDMVISATFVFRLRSEMLVSSGLPVGLVSFSTFAWDAVYAVLWLLNSILRLDLSNILRSAFFDVKAKLTLNIFSIAQLITYVSMM